MVKKLSITCSVVINCRVCVWWLSFAHPFIVPGVICRYMYALRTYFYFIFIYLYIYIYIYIYIFFFFPHGRFKLQNPLNASQRSGSNSGILHAQLWLACVHQISARYFMRNPVILVVILCLSLCSCQVLSPFFFRKMKINKQESGENDFSFS